MMLGKQLVNAWVDGLIELDELEWEFGDWIFTEDLWREQELYMSEIEERYEAEMFLT